MMRKLFLSLAMMTGIATSYAQQKLVLYYSENGTTKTVAEEIQKQLGADIEAVEAVEPYTGDFQATIQRGNKERANGQEATATIYITVEKGGKPEFTEVVR
ncbi:hypothetical protein [Prevotella sp. P6B4]|uniref:hypothetical protein n=1 Tax=Prevotella sp. P6B4 TaxID=1410614 RepID=UPI00048F72F9|nr:hypothetical protein [Prevotella sp. P6B4]